MANRSIWEFLKNFAKTNDYGDPYVRVFANVYVLAHHPGGYSLWRIETFNGRRVETEAVMTIDRATYALRDRKTLRVIGDATQMVEFIWKPVAKS